MILTVFWILVGYSICAIQQTRKTVHSDMLAVEEAINEI